MSVRNAAWRSFWMDPFHPNYQTHGLMEFGAGPISPCVDKSAGGGQGPGHHLMHRATARLVLIKSNDSNCISSQLAAH